MELKVGEFVEFKKYEDLSIDEIASVPEDIFPKYGKVEAVIIDNENVLYFSIEGSEYGFSVKSVARVIDLKQGDEVLAKVTVKKVFNGFIQIDPAVGDYNITKILKHEEPECFIVQEKYYGLYIGVSGDLVSDKDRAQIYTSREDADTDAGDMDFSRWDVIPYDD